jgi:mycothiol synthase
VNLPTGYRARPSRADDLPGALALLHARDVLEVGYPDSPPGFIDDAWRNPRVDVETDTLVVEAPDGVLAAYADVTHHQDPDYVTAWAPIHPAHRGRGIGTAVLGWIESRAAQETARALHQIVEGGDEAGHDLLTRAGFGQVRTHLHMVRSLDAVPDGAAPPVPAAITIRSMGDGEERAIHRVLQESFADHFALTVGPFDAWWDGWSDDPLFDPALVFVADRDLEGIVGVACDFVDDGVGWIGDLGVIVPWRGRGIAKALLAASFDAFRTRGLATARLNVDAENETGAADLYRSMGMHEHRRFLVFEKPLGKERTGAEG